MDIRKITIEDVNKNESEIINLFRQIREDNYPANLDMFDYMNNKAAKMRKYIQDDTAIIYGAFCDDVLIGFIWGYKKVYFGEIRLHIAHTVVDKSVRNTNTFLRLYLRLRNEAKKLGAVSSECMASYYNEELVERYLKAGYKIERVQMIKSLL